METAHALTSPLSIFPFIPEPFVFARDRKVAAVSKAWQDTKLP